MFALRWIFSIHIIWNMDFTIVTDTTFCLDDCHRGNVRKHFGENIDFDAHMFESD